MPRTTSRCPVKTPQKKRRQAMFNRSRFNRDKSTAKRTGRPNDVMEIVSSPLPQRNMMMTDSPTTPDKCRSAAPDVVMMSVEKGTPPSANPSIQANGVDGFMFVSPHHNTLGKKGQKGKIAGLPSVCRSLYKDLKKCQTPDHAAYESTAARHGDTMAEANQTVQDKNTIFSPIPHGYGLRSRKRLEEAQPTQQMPTGVSLLQHYGPVDEKKQVPKQLDLSDLELEESQTSFFTVQKLRHFQDTTPIRTVLGPKTSPHPITLVLDLDETLVHCATDANQLTKWDNNFQVCFQGREFNVYVKERPRVREFLESISQHFEVVIFTASQQIYADKLLDLMDPSRKFTHCVPVEGNFVKDLRCLNRDLSKTIIVDNAVEAFAYQLDNGIPIKSYFGTPDAELDILYNYLLDLAVVSDVCPALKRDFQMHERVHAVRDGLICDEEF